MENILEIQDLTKYFGHVCAVNRISFKLQAGEILGFLGPNGAGKSTTMKILCGFLVPTKGRVMLDGKDIQQHPNLAKAQIGYLPEGAPLYTDMTPLQFLSFIAEVRGFKNLEKQQRLHKIITALHLETILYEPIDTLSKGYKRRVGLAQALLHEPRLLILDEPTDGLDPNQKHEVRNLIKAIAATNTAILLSTHILEEVTSICTRCIIINHGKIIENNTPAALMAQRCQPFEEIFRHLTVNETAVTLN